MKLHPRTMPVQKAGLDFRKFTLDWIERNELTWGEVVGILSEALAMCSKYLKREERHPDDPDKRADEE